MNGIRYTGVPSAEELANCPGVPSEERMKKGRVACIECVQEIPCNPCEALCRFGAITVGEHITNLPVLDSEKCTGCGTCVAGCPGLAITILDLTFSETEASIDFPFEYLPLPSPGDRVEAVGRDGQTVCEGTIVRVTKIPSYAGTAVIRMAVPKEHIMQVRSMRRLRKNMSVEPATAGTVSDDGAAADAADTLICRCQEVTRGEIVDAIRDGAVTVDGVKRRTRACMGLCQGKTCGRLVERIIAEETGKAPAEVLPQRSRMPARPITIGMFRED